MNISRLTLKGQVTVPKELRDAFGWGPQTEVQFERLADGVKITRVAAPTLRGLRLVARLRGKGNRRRTTDEIMSLTRGDDR